MWPLVTASLVLGLNTPPLIDDNIEGYKLYLLARSGGNFHEKFPSPYNFSVTCNYAGVHGQGFLPRRVYRGLP
jgi:hypothetical protein